MPKTVLFLCTILSLAFGCSSTSSTGAGPADATDELYSKCGQPGDQGNSLGLGQFCNVITDCSNTTQAHLCSSLGNPDTHFCTFRCMAADAATPDGAAAFPTDCGSGATCSCDTSGQCGCVPNACL